MQASLRNLVERDALTGLYNRRFGQKRPAVLSHFRHSLHQSNYEGQNLSVTMTFGMINTACCATVDDILRSVDQLLYEGKEAGRNRLVVSSVDNNSVAT